MCDARVIGVLMRVLGPNAGRRREPRAESLAQANSPPQDQFFAKRPAHGCARLRRLSRRGWIPLFDLER